MLQDYEKLPEQVNLRNPIYVKRTADHMPDIGKKVRAGWVIRGIAKVANIGVSIYRSRARYCLPLMVAGLRCVCLSTGVFLSH